MVARFDRKFMALNQSVTHAASKASRVVPRSAGRPDQLAVRLRCACPLCVEMYFTQTFLGKLNEIGNEILD